jgi:hypothetical protein
VGQYNPSILNSKGTSAEDEPQMVTHEKEEHASQVPGRKKQIQFSKKKVRTVTAHSNNPDKSKGLLSLS